MIRRFKDMADAVGTDLSSHQVAVEAFKERQGEQHCAARSQGPKAFPERLAMIGDVLDHIEMHYEIEALIGTTQVQDVFMPDLDVMDIVYLSRCLVRAQKLAPLQCRVFRGHDFEKSRHPLKDEAVRRRGLTMNRAPCVQRQPGTGVSPTFAQHSFKEIAPFAGRFLASGHFELAGLAAGGAIAFEMLQFGHLAGDRRVMISKRPEHRFQ